MRLREPFFLLLLFVVVFSACGPGRLVPPFLDVRGLSVASDENRQAGMSQLREAVAAAGWRVLSPDTSSVIRTEVRELSGGTFSRAEASLELVPLSRGFVRVYVHASSWNLLGVRSKVYHLSSGLRQEILGELETELTARGFTTVKPGRER